MIKQPISYYKWSGQNRYQKKKQTLKEKSNNIWRYLFKEPLNSKAYDICRLRLEYKVATKFTSYGIRGIAKRIEHPRLIEISHFNEDLKIPTLHGMTYKVCMTRIMGGRRRR